MRNRAELAIIYVATQLTGAVFVPYNFRVSSRDLEYLVESADPDLLFFDNSTASIVEEIDVNRDDLSLVTVDDIKSFETYEEFLNGATEEFHETVVAPSEQSLILYTGGTTGEPKAVPRTHLNTYAAATGHAIQVRWSQGETILGLMSISHTMGIHSLVAAALLGGAWVGQRRFDAEQTVSLIESESISSLYLVPTVYHDLITSTAIETDDVSSVRNIAFAGTGMSPAMIRRISRYFDPDTFINHYGSTEVYTHTTCNRIDEKPGCVGKSGVNTRIRVVEPSAFTGPDPTDHVNANDLGEVIVATDSPEAFDGYLNPQQTERTVVKGWFFTGDLGYRDIEGDLFIVGRVDDMINSGGENIYPVEVEDTLESHGLVVEAAVVGRPSERWSQTVTAFITCDTDPDDVNFEWLAAELDEHCLRSSNLADFKRPRKYIFTDHLVKSNIGKILRKELQKPDPNVDTYAEIDT